MPKYLWLNNTLGTRRALSSASGYLVRELHGFSLPGKDHISARAPQQHGATYLDTFFRPRECALVILVKGCNADDFQAKHRALVRAMNPLDECELRVETDGHERYTLACRPVTAFEVQRHNAISADVLVQLVADDPFFHSATEDEDFTSGLTGGLFIAFTVPGIICDPANQSIFTITNNGHVLTYPTITIDGPAENLALYNDTIGQSLTVEEVLAAGSQLIIDMGNRTAMIVTGAAETNVLGSCAGTFWGLAVGDNDIRIISDDPNIFTGTLSYYERYLTII